MAEGNRFESDPIVGDVGACGPSNRRQPLSSRAWLRALAHEAARTSGIGIALSAIGFVACAAALAAQAPSAEDIADGLRIYRQKADCQACHGWAGDGRKMDTQMPDGPNLRISKLTRDELVRVIKCGRPGKGMPAFDRLAYSDGRCNDIKLADLKKAGLALHDPAATLQMREVEAVVAFLMAKVVGQGPMDKAKCVEFWGSEVDACSELAK